MYIYNCLFLFSVTDIRIAYISINRMLGGVGRHTKDVL